MLKIKNKLKKLVKENDSLKRFYEYIFHPPIINYFNKKSSHKKALFSYSTYHFKKNNYRAHSNYQESIIIAQSLDILGYSVDIVNNNKETKLDLSQYDLIIGEGLPLYQSLLQHTKAKRIYYATGSHPLQCTYASLQRLFEFKEKYGCVLTKSTRIQDIKWGIAASTSDHVICIGNENTKKTFQEFGVKNISLIDPTFHLSTKNFKRDLDNINKSRKTALWFGSYGLLHKGLDLTLEAFKNKKDWTLHVCGYTEQEYELIQQVGITDNIYIHGFLDLESESFNEITKNALFVILPSCSEGIATSVITAMGRTAMIPIVTKESGVDIDQFGFEIDQLTVPSILKSLNICDKCSPETLVEKSKSAYKKTISRYNIENYKKNIIHILNRITHE